MATSFAHDAKHDDQSEPRAGPLGRSLLTRAEWLWTLVSLALLGAFVSFVVDDFPLRTLIAAN